MLAGALAGLMMAAQRSATGNATAPEQSADDEPQAPTITETISADVQTIANKIIGTDAAGMHTSAAGLRAIQQWEGLSLTPYKLGDGQATIGWGRAYPLTGPAPPERITRETADEWFAIDVQDRAEKWVRAYVTAPLTPPQFDALASIAYNMSPASFRTIAQAVNAGEDPEAAALRYVRAGTNLERGLRRRRAAEIAIYRTDPNAYG